MSFRLVVGHHALVLLVAKAVENDSLPPSLLFTGPDGVGKRLVAQAIAQALNCDSPVRSLQYLADVARSQTDRTPELDACDCCASCKRIARGTYADVVNVVPGENGSITVEQIRKVIDQTAYRPFEGRRRVVIINEADRLVQPAQNALLKTLEEPPASSQFVLVTSRPDTLRDTVRSRCPQLRFGQLEATDIAQVLVGTHGFAVRDARAAAATAWGSLGRALESVTGEFTVSRDAAVSVLQALSAARDPRARLEGGKMLLTEKRRGRLTPTVERNEMLRRLQALTSLLRDIELLSVSGNMRGLANADLRDSLAALAPLYGRGRSRNAFWAVDRALEAVGRNVSPKVIADWLACQM